MSTQRLLVGPFNRVEGDLEVKIDVVDGRVASAHVNAPMYRGFEQILQGKEPRDALVYVPRICGICSVSQSVAAARALAALAGAVTPPNGLLACNLMLATENLADHLTHFYLFFMPDFTREVYAGQAWHADALRRFEAQRGEHARLAIAARQRWFELMGTLGGRWPHTHSLQPGGSSRPIEASERIRLTAKVREFRLFLEKTLFGGPLEAVGALSTEDELLAWCSRAPQADLSAFVGMSQALGLGALGAGPGLYLCYGSFNQPDGSWVAPPGVWNGLQHAAEELLTDGITEDATHAWLAEGGTPRHPAEGLTLPEPGKAGAYTWNKAPRLHGRVVETGAIARQLMAGQPLVRETVRRCGGTVYTRVLARLLELARVVPMMEQWLRELRPGEPWCDNAALPQDGTATGLAEAARGSLGHWVTVRHGCIAGYQIVAPTTWNFSPRDAQGAPGALERALEGAPVREGETTPVAVQHVVRSFDPCMVCTVH